MDNLYLATIKVTYNDDVLYYVESKEKWYILKEFFLEPLFRKSVCGQLAYKEKGGAKAYYHSKMKRNSTKCSEQFPIGLPCPF